jgi:hypothetical protein
MICMKAVFLAGLTLCVSYCSLSQTVISAKNGSWNDPSTWIGEIVPSVSNSTSVLIDHDVSIEGDTVFSHSIEVRGNLLITSTGTLILKSVDGSSGYFDVTSGTFRNSGFVVGEDGITYSTVPSNTFFEHGSVFQYNGGPKGYIPLATWDKESTLLITGFKSSGYIGLAFSSSWRQNFGNVIYDCPAQTTFVDFNGHLKSIAGNFTIRSTNSQSLRLSTTQKPVINIAGDFIVEGQSEVWITTTSDSTRLFIGKDLIYNSTSTGPSYFTTRGKCWVSIEGNLKINSSGPLRLCSGSVDSTGVRKTTFKLKGNLITTKGSFIAPYPGKGVFIFSGSSLQQLVCSSNGFNGYFDFHFEPGCLVDFGASAIGGVGNNFIRGHLTMGSTDVLGALQTSGGGNIRTNGSRYFYPGATIEYNGNGPQFIGSGHPSNKGVNLVCNNPSTIDLLQDLNLNDFFFLKGNLRTNDKKIEVSGDLIFLDSISVGGNGTFIFKGNKSQIISGNRSVIQNLEVSKDPGSEIVIASNLYIAKSAAIKNDYNVIEANGFLTLLSLNDGEDGTAYVESIPDHSSIKGKVVVQRHMAGEGRIYRYLSSSVSNATVKDLMDDFPVTGSFKDPSTAKGVNSLSPSLFYFDENISESESGWKAYPTNGFASENSLIVGLGYAAYIRKAGSSTVWDVSGILNQGEISIPLRYTETTTVDKRGWNLIGNPYASPIDYSKEEGWKRSGGISVAFAIRDNPAGKFHYYDGDIGDLPSGRVASGQAFWIRTSQSGATLAINERAKVREGAVFYREKLKPFDHDYIRLTLSGKNSVDKAYLRRRNGASRNEDVMDAVKMRNDFLSLSFLTDDSIRVAINAIDTFRCEEQFPICLEIQSSDESSSGDYTFSIDSFGLFKNCDVRILDTFLNVVSDSSVYSFSVTKDKKSFQERFKLAVRSRLEGHPQIVTTAAFTCRDSVYKIMLHNLMPHSVYFAQVNGTKVHAVVDGKISGEILIPTSILQPGEENIVYVKNESFCQENFVDSLSVFYEQKPKPPVLSEAYRCDLQQSKIILRPLPHGMNFDWFYSDEDRKPFFVTADTVFFPPELPKKEFYFVAVSSKSGCRGDRIKITPENRKFDPVVIHLSKDSLISNYKNNVWFLNGTRLSKDSTGGVSPVSPGGYTARTLRHGCTLEGSFYFEGDSVTDIIVTPIPFGENLSISLLDRNDVIRSIRIFTMEGKEQIKLAVHSPDLVIETKNLSHGIYIAEIGTNSRRYRIKIMK